MGVKPAQKSSTKIISLNFVVFFFYCFRNLNVKQLDRTSR